MMLCSLYVDICCWHMLLTPCSLSVVLLTSCSWCVTWFSWYDVFLGCFITLLVCCPAYFQLYRVYCCWHHVPNVFKKTDHDTGWQRPIGCLKLQVYLRRRATNYRALLRKTMIFGILLMKTSIVSSLRCMHFVCLAVWLSSCLSVSLSFFCPLCLSVCVKHVTRRNYRSDFVTYSNSKREKKHARVRAKTREGGRKRTRARESKRHRARARDWECQRERERERAMKSARARTRVSERAREQGRECEPFKLILQPFLLIPSSSLPLLSVLPSFLPPFSFPPSSQLPTATPAPTPSTATSSGASSPRRSPRATMSHNHATHCCNTPKHTVTLCNTLEQTATHCITLQHTATYCKKWWIEPWLHEQ